MLDRDGIGSCQANCGRAFRESGGPADTTNKVPAGTAETQGHKGSLTTPKGANKCLAPMMGQKGANMAKIRAFFLKGKTAGYYIDEARDKAEWMSIVEIAEWISDFVPPSYQIRVFEALGI